MVLGAASIIALSIEWAGMTIVIIKRLLIFLGL